MPTTNILRRNQLALSSFDPQLSARLAGIDPGKHISYIESRTNLLVPVYNTVNRKQPLHSQYDPLREGEKLMRAYEAAGFLVFLGFGAGYHILPFLERKEISNIFIIDRDLPLFRSVMEHIDLRSLIMDHRVRFLLNMEPEEIKQTILGHYIPALDGNLKTIPLLSRLNTDNEYFSGVVNSIKEIISRVADDFTVQVQFGRKWFTNTLHNLKSAEHSTCLLQSGHRILVSGAGPSLDEQIPKMKDLRRESFLIATDTSLPALLSHDILPDIVISIDCQHISYHHFIRGLPPGIPLVLDLASPPILTRLTDKIIFIASNHPFSRYVINHWRMFPAIDISGGNVSHAALSLANRLGAREIYLFGMDFSFPEGKSYARDTYQYKYFRNIESRLSPLDSLFFTSIFRNKKVLKEKTPEFIRYTTRPMISYKKRMEEAVREMQADVRQIQGNGLPLILEPQRKPGVPQNVLSRMIAQGAASTSWKDFLRQYLKMIRELPEPYFPIKKYLNDLSHHQRDLWTTQYPAAASLREYAFNAENPLSSTLLKATREWTCARLVEVLQE